MKLPRHSPVAYNPHLLRREALLESFVARQPLLDEILDDLRRGGKQHHLLIGPRGSGKTTFLLRLGFAIEDDKKLARRAIALRFPEEQYNVGQLSDFWLNCADALVDALERRGDQDAVRELEKQIEIIEALPEADRAPEGLKLLTDWTHKSKRNLILLVDNLDLILDRLDAAHWPMRETFSADNGLVLVGASSSFIQDTFAYESPFYDFFNVHDLGPLTEAEGRALILRLAETTHTPHVKDVIESDPGRFTALFILSGGSPRTLTLLHGVLAREQTSRAEEDLEHLLDTVTPYYKARFDDLPVQSQLIVNAVALHWHPMTAAECAAETRIDVSQVSAQLNRLVRQGVLSKVPGAEPHKLSFQVTERFFNIWYLMRASRRMRRKLLWLVNFLHAFYGEAEVERRAAALLDTPEGRKAVDDPAKLLAFATAVKDATLRRRLEFRAVEALLAEPSYRRALAELLDLQGEDAHLAPVVDRVGALRRVRSQVRGAKQVKRLGFDGGRLAEAVASSPFLNTATKVMWADIVSGADSHLVTKANCEKMIAASEMVERLVGSRFCEVIARGELPSPEEVRTTAEIDALFATAAQGKRHLVAAVIVGAIAARDDGLALIDHVAALEPSAYESLPRAVAVLLASGRRERAGELLKHAFNEGTAQSLSAMLGADHWRPFVAVGRAIEAAELLEETHAAGGLMPLAAALRAAGAGRKPPLTELAPEIRTTAETILSTLVAVASASDTRVEKVIKGRVRRGPVASQRGKSSTKRASPR